MARSRNIKPGLFKNELLGEADPIYTILFAGLWCLADRDGRLENRPRRIKAEIFPYRPEVDVDSALTWLASAGFVTPYEVAGEKYIQVANWEKHQTPHHKEVASVIPANTPIKKPKQKPSKPHAQIMDESSIDDASDKKDASTPLIPDSLLLIPDSLNSESLIPDSGFPHSDPAGSVDDERKAPSSPTGKVEPKTSATWDAYSGEYEARYGILPVRNAKVNSLLAKVVDRLGADDSPHVAAFYVRHNASWYVSRGHSVDSLLNDAEKLRTEWATGRKVTSIQARQVEKTQANLDSHNEALAILQAKGHTL